MNYILKKPLVSQKNSNVVKNNVKDEIENKEKEKQYCSKQSDNNKSIIELKSSNLFKQFDISDNKDKFLEKQKLIDDKLLYIKQQQEQKQKLNLQRDQAFKELQKGESKYIQKLNFLNDMRNKLIQMNIISASDMQKLFTNIKQIFLFHSTNFLLDFEEFFKKGLLYRVQMKLDDFLLYQENIKFVDERSQLFTELYQKNQSFKQFQDQYFYHLPLDKEKITTKDCINLPFDRLFKYGMIFDRILKYTDQSEDNYQALINVKNKMNTIIKKINGRKGLKELQNNLKCLDLCDNESRLLIDEVETIQHDENYYQAFLCTDMIILKPKNSGQLKIVYLDDNSKIFEKKSLGKQMHRFQIQGVYHQDNVVFNAETQEIVNQFKRAMNQLQTVESTEDICINIIGTYQMHDGNYEVYTLYIIEITKGFLLTRLFLRSSQIWQISQICKSQFNQTKIKLNKRFHVSLYKNTKENISKKIKDFELFLQQVFKNSLIQQQPISILQICGLPNEFFQVCQTVEDEKTIIQMECGESSYSFEVLVEIFFDENPKVYKINSNTNAYQLCKQIAIDLELNEYDDFRLFFKKNDMIEEVIDNFQKISIFNQQKKQLQLIFKQYIFLDAQKKQQEIRLKLIANQILQDIHNLKYNLSKRDYALIVALVMHFKQKKDQTYYIKKLIPYEILAIQDDFNWAETANLFYLRLISVMDNQAKAYLTLYNFIKQKPFYGGQFFWIRCRYNKKIKEDITKTDLQFVWLFVDSHQIQFYDEDKQDIKISIQYKHVNSLNLNTKKLVIQVYWPEEQATVDFKIISNLSYEIFRLIQTYQKGKSII